MIRKFSLILLSIALVVGCSDDRTLDSTTDVSIRVENGRLAFRDLDAFNSTISEFYKMDQDQLTNWRKQFKFKSLDEKLVEVAQSADDDLVVDETYRTFPKSHLYMLNSFALTLLPIQLQIFDVLPEQYQVRKGRLKYKQVENWFSRHLVRPL